MTRLVPPRRFASARFATYLPDPAHPSQAAALAAMERFTAAIGEAPKPKRWRKQAAAGTAARVSRRRLRRRQDPPARRGLARSTGSRSRTSRSPSSPASSASSAWSRRSTPSPSHRLLCIDEFELDDIAQTLMTVTFLRAVIAAGVKVVATSNSLPDRLGEGRFAADEFTREIAAIAAHFEVVRIDGPDYRAKARVEAEPFAADRGRHDGADVDDRRRDGERRRLRRARRPPASRAARAGRSCARRARRGRGS